MLGKHGSVVETGSFQDLIAIPNSELNALLAEQQDEEGKERTMNSDSGIAQEV